MWTNLSKLYPDKQLLIRPKGAKIKKIIITDEQLAKIDEIKEMPLFSKPKEDRIRDLIGSLCCICSGIPSIELRWPVGDKIQPVTRIERYCEPCSKKIYSHL